MSRAERRLRRAIRITPPRDRDRYADEWRGDLAAAEELGLSPADVARGASRVAWHLRAQHSVRTLAGGEGFGRAAVAWIAVAVSLPGLCRLTGVPPAFMLGLGIPATMVVALVLAVRSGPPASVVVMAAAGPLWLVCTAFSFWYEWDPVSHAADPLSIDVGWFWFWFRIGPFWPSDLAFWLAVGSFIAFWAAFGVSVARNSPSRAHRAEPAHPGPTGD